MISKAISIEELVTTYPSSVRFLIERGITPVVCGEPLWETLEEAAKRNGYSDEQIEEMVVDLIRSLEAKKEVVPLHSTLAKKSDL
jgi:hypothetical protein